MRRPSWRLLVPALLVSCAGACETANAVRFDSAPISLNSASGGLMIAALTDDSDGPIAAVLDTLTPTSIVDRLRPPAAELPLAAKSVTNLRLASACDGDDPVGSCTPITRALFENAVVVDVHPCQDATATCEIGAPDIALPYTGIVGGDLLSRLAVRLDTAGARPTLQLFDDQPGSNRQRCSAGEAVFATGLAGGGTVLIQGGESSFPATRLALNTCLGVDPDNLSIPQGSDALLLLATGIGPSLLSENAYERLRRSFDEVDPQRPPPLENLTVSELNLPSGKVIGRSVTIPTLAIVDQIGNQTSETRGACREWHLRANLGDDALVEREGLFTCVDNPATPFDERTSCPCAIGEIPRAATEPMSCQAAATATIRPANGLPFLIVADQLAILQALRVELRPAVAEVDGLLGASALVNARIDLDYPNGRILWRCAQSGTEPEPCVHLTAILDRTSPGAPIDPAARCAP